MNICMSQRANRRGHGLAGANLNSSPIEDELHNTVIMSEVHQLDDELLTQFNSKVRQQGGRRHYPK